MSVEKDKKEKKIKSSCIERKNEQTKLKEVGKKPSSKVLTENFKFFQHRSCEFFPCHDVKDDSKFNCLFCYCPLYTLGDRCGGNFQYINGEIKDCSKCLVPHGQNSYDYIISMWSKVDALAKTQIHDNNAEKNKNENIESDVEKESSR